MLLPDVALTSYQHNVYRIVESQEEAATMSLVDNMDEQARLESLLDKGKPPYKKGTEPRHYLVSTPFRYPPLKHGSRFGDRTQPSFYYASESLNTCLTEATFYRFVFIRDKRTPFSKNIVTEHHAFTVNVETAHCADLTSIEDQETQDKMQDKTRYTFTQSLGKKLRMEGAQVIRYFSARQKNGINVAIDAPKAIISETPENMIPIRCEIDTQANVIRFKLDKSLPIAFKESIFTVNGTLPRPA